jgi:hypothetical protein
MIAMKIIAAIACFVMAMMAAKDAETARLRGRVMPFVMFMLFAMCFAASFIWVLFA